MSDVFIAHVEEDADVALGIALGLEEAGYTTWCYEVDSYPGPSYLIQTGQAVAQTKAVVVVISPHSIGSSQVTKEIVRAHESGSQFVPILRGITHIEFQNRQPEWREAIGAATSIGIPPAGVASILPSIIGGLKSLGVLPSLKAEATHIARIRRAMDEQRGQVTLAEGQELPVPSGKPEPEAIVAEGPPAKTAEEARGRQRWIKPGVIASAIVVVVIIAVILLGQSEEPQPSPPSATSSPAPEVQLPPSPTPSPTPEAQMLPSPIPSLIPEVQPQVPTPAPTPTPTTPATQKLTLADSSTLLDLSALLPPSFKKADAAAEGFSNEDLALGPDFSEVELFMQEDPFQFIVCYMGIVEDSFTRSMLDAVFKDDEQVKALIETNMMQGLGAADVDTGELNLQITHPDIGDAAVFGEGYISAAGINMGYDISVFREDNVFVNIESMYFSSEKQSIESFATEIVRRINTYGK